MRKRWIAGGLGVAIGMLSLAGELLAADGSLSDGATLEHLRTAIEAEADPELKSVMQEQLKLVESGQLDLRSAEAVERTEQGVALAAPPLDPTGAGVGGPLAGAGLVGPPVDTGTGGPPAGEYLPPEVRGQLEQLFQEKGTGDPANDAHVREEAERILRDHGIDPREIGPGHDTERGAHREEERPAGLERAMEHMAPEAREQLERLSTEHEFEHVETSRELPDRELRESMDLTHEREALEAPAHEYEAPAREFELPALDREMTAPELQAPEPPETMPREYESQPPTQP